MELVDETAFPFGQLGKEEALQSPVVLVERLFHDLPVAASPEFQIIGCFDHFPFIIQKRLSALDILCLVIP